MATLPLASLAAVVSPTGVTAPSYADILGTMQLKMQAIYGTDIYLGPDTQDGQLLAIVAQAIYDANQTAVAVYGQFSPATAQGAGLSSSVKVNGIRRLVPSNSQVDLLIGGTVGTVIQGGIASDNAGNQWLLPPSVTIPLGGTVTATATCKAPGAVAAAVGTVSTIATPTLGWYTVTNPSDASRGAPVEDDATLRRRQQRSVGLPALTVLESTVAAIAAIAGVTQVKAYENPTGAADANGVPAHSISMVVQGGDATLVATAIAKKKTPGCGTYGSTTVNVVDAVGITHAINFYVPTQVRIKVAVTIHALGGYVSTTGDALKAAVAAYINALGIGQAVMLTRLSLPAQLFNGPLLAQYELTTVQDSVYPAAVASLDIPIPFNQQASCAVADIALTVT